MKKNEKFAPKRRKAKIVWDREREPSGSYNHIGYVVGDASAVSLVPEYWVFNLGERYRADHFPYTGVREHIGDTKRLPRAKKLCRRHLKRSMKRHVKAAQEMAKRDRSRN